MCACVYVCFVHTQLPWNCTTSMLFLKYLLKVWGSEDPQQFEDLISNHERMLTHLPMRWQKERGRHCMTPVCPGKGWTTLTWHLRLPHPTCEDLLSSFLDPISFAADTQPSIACSERWWAASTQATILILFGHAARPDTPPAPLNVDIAHEATLLLYLQSKHIQTWVTLTGQRVSFWTGWSWKPTRLSKF